MQRVTKKKTAKQWFFEQEEKDGFSSFSVHGLKALLKDKELSEAQRRIVEKRLEDFRSSIKIKKRTSHGNRYSGKRN